MRTEVDQAKYQDYLDRCSSVVRQADHYVESGWMSYEQIEIQSGVGSGTLNKMAVDGAAPELAVLNKLEMFLWGREVKERAVVEELQRSRQRLADMHRDMTSLFKECGTLKESADECLVELQAEREAHERTKAAMLALATEHAVAVDSLMRVRVRAQRLQAQVSSLLSVLHGGSSDEGDLVGACDDGRG